MTRRWLGAFVLMLIVGCSSNEEPAACLAKLELGCTPAYEPSYDAIFDNLLTRSCGSASTGNVCHHGASTQSGLSLSDREAGYDALLGLHGAKARVTPGDPECSPLVQRLESSDPNFRMPVGGAPLSLNERCVIRQWIANGAER